MRGWYSYHIMKIDSGELVNYWNTLTSNLRQSDVRLKLDQENNLSNIKEFSGHESHGERDYIPTLPAFFAATCVHARRYRFEILQN